MAGMRSPPSRTGRFVRPRQMRSGARAPRSRCRMAQLYSCRRYISAGDAAAQVSTTNISRVNLRLPGVPPQSHLLLVPRDGFVETIVVSPDARRLAWLLHFDRTDPLSVILAVSSRHALSQLKSQSVSGSAGTTARRYAGDRPHRSYRRRREKFRTPIRSSGCPDARS